MTDAVTLAGRHKRFERTLAVADPGLGLSAKILLMRLDDLIEAGASPDNKIVFPGSVCLAAALGMERHAISVATKELCHQGILEFDGGKPALGDRCTLAQSPHANLSAWATVTKAMADAAGASPRSSTRTQRSEQNKADWAEKQGKAKASNKITDAEKQIICASYENMKTYILWGRDAITDPTTERKPSPLNWLVIPGLTATDARYSEWTAPQIAGYWWYLVSWFRNERNIPLTIPDWGRLIGEISRSPLTNEQRHAFMSVAVGNYDEICEMCRGIEPPVLNDRSFTNGLLTGKVAQIQQGLKVPSKES